MHIMFFYYSLSGGGAERVITSLANLFVSKGVSVTIAVLEEKEIAYYIDTRVNIVNIESKLREYNQRNSKLSWTTCLRNEIKNRKPDVVIAFSLELYILAEIASSFLPVKTIGSERSATKWETASLRKKVLMWVASVLCDGFIFLTSNGMKSYPKAIWKKAAVIPNAVYANPILQSNQSLVNQKFNCIVSVGRLIKGKDFTTLLRAFASFHHEFPEYTLDIFGVGPEKDNLINLTKKLKIDGSVNFMGHVNDIPAVLSKYSMFVFTSRSEGMPNALIEAMANGLPCISTDCSFGPSELIENGLNGLLVPVGDVKGIKASMVRIATDKEFSTQLSKKALEIQDTHSTDVIYNKYSNYISNVIEIK